MRADEKAAMHGDEALSFAIRTLRETFLSYPYKQRLEIYQRARELAEAHPKSYLARHWQAIYGRVNP